MTNGSMSFILELKAEGTANIHANHDVILNQEYGQASKYGKNQMIHLENQSQLNISANHDIRFNNKGVNRVVFGTNKAGINFKAGNDIIYDNRRKRLTLFISWKLKASVYRGRTRYYPKGCPVGKNV